MALNGTQTSTAIPSTTVPRAVHAGLQAATAYWSASASAPVSAMTVFMLKVPHGAVIKDVIGHWTSGAASCPTDVGVVGALARFGSGTQGTVFRATEGLPYTVSATTTGYEIITITPTIGTETASLKADLTVFYDMDAVN